MGTGVSEDIYDNGDITQESGIDTPAILSDGADRIERHSNGTPDSADDTSAASADNHQSLIDGAMKAAHSTSIWRPSTRSTRISCVKHSWKDFPALSIAASNLLYSRTRSIRALVRTP